VEGATAKKIMMKSGPSLIHPATSYLIDGNADRKRGRQFVGALVLFQWWRRRRGRRDSLRPVSAGGWRAFAAHWVSQHAETAGVMRARVENEVWAPAFGGWPMPSRENKTRRVASGRRRSSSLLVFSFSF
jgi:hypothetical protein